MTIKKWLSILLMLSISTFIFTACEEDPDPETESITVLPVGTISVGQTGDNAITVQWEASSSTNESWFAGYELTISAQGEIDDVKTLLRDQLRYECTGLNLTRTYTFSIRALGTDPNLGSTEKSTVKSIDWALASHFTKNDMNATIKVYVKESANYGSGLNLFDEEGVPSNWKVANGAKWNLALGSKSELIFGTASTVATKMSYNLTGTPVDAEISDPIDFDTDNLNNLFLDADLSKITYSKKYIDLNSSVATSKSKGLVFFAKINNHYAKIVVLKKDGKYLQDETTNDPYVQVLVSYQERVNQPYAKPTN